MRGYKKILKSHTHLHNSRPKFDLSTRELSLTPDGGGRLRKAFYAADRHHQQQQQLFSCPDLACPDLGCPDLGCCSQEGGSGGASSFDLLSSLLDPFEQLEREFELRGEEEEERDRQVPQLIADLCGQQLPLLPQLRGSSCECSDGQCSSDDHGGDEESCVDQLGAATKEAEGAGKFG